MLFIYNNLSFLGNCVACESSYSGNTCDNADIEGLRSFNHFLTYSSISNFFIGGFGGICGCC